MDATDDSKEMNPVQHAWSYRLAIGWFFLFSINSLCTITIASLTGAQWSSLDAQHKLLIIIAIVGNWTGVIMAYISKASKRAEAGQPPELSNGSTPASGSTVFLGKPPTQNP